MYHAPTKSEEEYNRYQQTQKRFEELFTKETIAECMNHGNCQGLGYSVSCRDGVFDEFMQIPGHGVENFGKIKDIFFKIGVAVSIFEQPHNAKTIRGKTNRRFKKSPNLKLFLAPQLYRLAILRVLALILPIHPQQHRANKPN